MDMKKDLCVFCSGEMENKIITVSRDRGGNITVFKNVPAQVCRKCGEPYFSLETMKEMEERLLKRVKPKLHVKVPVYTL